MERRSKRRRNGDDPIKAACSAAPTTEFALERLPDELLLATLSLLPLADLATIAGVCRRFAELCRDGSLWRVHIERLTCRHLSQVSKPPSQTWCQHYQRLSFPPTRANVCRVLPNDLDLYASVPNGFDVYATLEDCMNIVTADEIIQYRAPGEPGPIDEGNVVGRLPAADGRKWTGLRRLGPFLIAGECRRLLGVRPRERRAVLLDCNLTVLQSVGVQSRWLLFDRRIVTVCSTDVSTADETSTGVDVQHVGRLPFPIDREWFAFVATEGSFGVIVDTVRGGVTRWWNVTRTRKPQLKFVEISTTRGDSGGPLMAVLDEIMLPYRLPARSVQLASIDDAYLVLSVVALAPNRQLDVFAVRTRRTTSLTLWGNNHVYIMHCAPAPATGLLYVSLQREGAGHSSRDSLLFAFNSSGACLWSTELPLSHPGPAGTPPRRVRWWDSLHTVGCYPVLAVRHMDEPVTLVALG